MNVRLTDIAVTVSTDRIDAHCTICHDVIADPRPVIDADDLDTIVEAARTHIREAHP